MADLHETTMQLEVVVLLHQALGAAAALFLGQGRSRGHALVAPALESWVASRIQEESAVLKERRKWREEHILAAGLAIPAPSGGGGDGGGGATPATRS